VKLHPLIDRLQIPALRGHHLAKDPQRRAIGQLLSGNPLALLRTVRLAAQINHPPGKNQRYLAQIFTQRRPLTPQ
jgi:hypothetical protein